MLIVELFYDVAPDERHVDASISGVCYVNEAHATDLQAIAPVFQRARDTNDKCVVDSNVFISCNSCLHQFTFNFP